MAAMRAGRSVIWRGSANPEVTVDNLVLEAVGRTKQVDQDQRSKGASSVGNLDILQGNLNRERQGYSIALLHFQ